jgi:hypothetical protein
VEVGQSPWSCIGLCTMSFEHEVFRLHSSGQLDNSLLHFFLPNGEIRPSEGPMWDYKVGFIKPNSVIKSGGLLHCDLLKDIAGMYNAFGGYLIIAFTDAQQSSFDRFAKKDELDQLAHSYLNAYIPVAPLKLRAEVGGTVANVLFIHIDKRVIPAPIAFKKNSAAKPDGTLIFKRDDIPFRYGSSSLIINQNHDLLVFAFGERKPDIGELPTRLNEINNNLPPRDPNLIEFVGRRNYLIELWNWLADVRNPVKVLTALGGTGKTAIAYEFCEQIVKARSKTFDKVIWLTAKSQTYAAILQGYVSTTRTDFTDVASFLDAFLREIGCLEKDFKQFDQPQDKLDFAKEIIKDIPILLVIDDLDSLDHDKQIDLFSRIVQLFDQALSDKTQSRVLFTSRLEPNTGENRVIRVRGFSRDETSDYVDVLLRHLDATDTWGTRVKASIGEIHEASKGSPIFITSIIRLISFGDSVDAVIADWKGKDGEVVRRFAFKREIDSLQYSDWRTLYVLQMLSATTFEELRELLEVDRHNLRNSLVHLSQFHMFAGDASPATGAQISVPEPVRLMVDITEENLNAADAEELRKKCARIIKNDGQTEVGRAIRAISLLWRRGNNVEALTEAVKAVKEFPKSGELSCVLGRTYLLQAQPDLVAADTAFREAHNKKYDNPELIEYWALTKLKKGEIAQLLKLTSGGVTGAALLYRLAGIYRIARQREEKADDVKALESYQMLVREGVAGLKHGKTEPASADVSRMVREVSDYLIEVARRAYQSDWAGPEKVLELAAELAKDGFPPQRQLNPAIQEFMTYAKSHGVRSHGRALQHLRVLRLEVGRAHGKDYPLVSLISDAERALRARR